MRPYLLLFRALSDARVHYAVAGGFAAVLHGVPRMTFDLDLVVDLSQDNLQRLVHVLDAEGYRPRLPVKLSELLDSQARASWTEERNRIAFSLYHSERPMEEVDILLVTTPSWKISSLVASVDVSKTWTYGSSDVRPFAP